MGLLRDNINNIVKSNKKNAHGQAGALSALSTGRNSKDAGRRRSYKNSAGVKKHDSTDKTNPCFFNYP
jgi:hypothetical protein